MYSQLEQAKLFHQLHTFDQPLLLANAWDVGSAKAIEASGARAVATSSWAIANAYGYDDGEKIPLSLVLDNICRIRESVKCPITLDIETGYSTTPEGVKETIIKIIQKGVVGINLEDQNLHDNNGHLYSIDEQTKRIANARHAAEEVSIPLFINARTDVFFKPSDTSEQEKLDEVINRAHAYAKSGANGIFVPGLTDKPMAKLLCQKSPLPVNLMLTTLDNELIDYYSNIGVSRISFGPFPYIHAMKELTDLGKKILC